MSKRKKTNLIDHKAGTQNETIKATIDQQNITLPLKITSSSGSSFLSDKTIRTKKLYAANKAKKIKHQNFAS